MTIANAPDIVASVIRTEPAISTPPARPIPSFSSISTDPSTNAITPIGTLTKKIQCQLSDCVSAPPASSPIEPPPAETNAYMPIAFACSRALRELRDDDREDHARGDRPADPLKQPREDQQRLVLGDPAQDRRRREEDEAREKDLLAPDQVADPAGEQQEAAEGDQVAVEDPREVRLGEVEIALDRGKRDVDDRRIQHHHQLPQAQDCKGDPATALARRVGI